VIRAGIRRVFRLALRRRDHWEAEVEDEIKLHLALRAEQLMAAGRDPNTAYVEAVQRFGSPTESRARLLEAARHRERKMERTEWLADLKLDATFALRTLARQRAWTSVTIATLALGIAATTAVFSVVSTLLLHPLPYPHSDRIVFVDEQPSEGNNTGISVTIFPPAPAVRAWMAGAHGVEQFTGSMSSTRTLKTASGEPSHVHVGQVFPSFPDFAGVRPMAGRMFSATDIENGGRVVVLGEGFWRSRLGADTHVLGKMLTLGDTAYTVVGVVPSTLGFGASDPQPVDVWLPLDVRNDKIGVQVMARLKPGVSVAAITTELDSIFARSSGFSTGKVPFRTVVTSPGQRVQFKDSLIMLAAAVALVLLVACANVAHLLLARSATRQREMAIRTALGAGRGRLSRQLLTESLILTVGGTLCGVFGGWAGLKILITLRPHSLDALTNAHLDGMTLALAVSIALVSAVLFTFIGARQARRHGTHDSLKSGTSAAGASRRSGRARSLLVVSEMALSATLLVGATLLVRSVMRLQSAELGFDAKGLYVLRVPLLSREAGTPSPFAAAAARAAAMSEFMSRLHAMPGIRSATVADVEPGRWQFSIGRLELDGEPAPPQNSSAFVDVNTVQPTYFATMGIHLESGSTFTDTTSTSLQVIVNSGFAHKHWPQGSAVGRRLRIAQSDSTPWRTIVGVADNAQTRGPGTESTALTLYSPMTHIADAPRVLVRVAGSASVLAPATAILKQLGVVRPPPPESVGRALRDDGIHRCTTDPRNRHSHCARGVSGPNCASCGRSRRDARGDRRRHRPERGDLGHPRDRDAALRHQAIGPAVIRNRRGGADRISLGRVCGTDAPRGVGRSGHGHPRRLSGAALLPTKNLSAARWTVRRQQWPRDAVLAPQDRGLYDQRCPNSNQSWSSTTIPSTCISSGAFWVMRDIT
jgi:predicted permease